jgi:cardiolipin synthase
MKMSLTNPTNNWLTWPNVLTFFRLLASIPLCYFIVRNDSIGAVLFISLAAFSDYLDGYLARKLNQESKLGKTLDPFVDKILGGSAIVTLCIMGKIPWSLLWLFLTRDVFLVIATLILLWQKKQLVAETKVGKYSTGLFMLGLALVVANIPVANIPYAIYIFYACLILYLFSGLLYSIRIFQSPQAKELKAKAKAYISESRSKTGESEKEQKK